MFVIRSTARLARGARCLSSGGVSFNITDDQRAISDLVRSFVKDQVIPQAAESDRTMKFPQELFAQAHSLGLVNIHVPEIAGGLGLHTMEGVLCAEEMAYGCSGFGTAIEANTLASMPVILGGTDAQKKEYLGRLVDAPIQAGYCVSEACAGSDVAAIETKAVKKGDDWVINGSKVSRRAKQTRTPCDT